MRISTWAGLHNRQAELDFVDVDTDSDARLFVDPYAIDIRDDAWSAACSQHLRSFFSALLRALRDGDDARAEHLASHLHETNETRLGLSSGAPRGRGIGRDQALQILDALRHSNAFKTGLLTDLAEAELFIDGIGSDKISDLTTNIIRGPLIQYTIEQANVWNMPLTDHVALSPTWDPNREDWTQAPRTTIVVDGSPIILVPKYAVRRKLSLNSQEFYNQYMISYLQGEYMRAGQALVHVLKSGDRRVYKTEVKALHPGGKPNLAEFASQHPDVLEQYKRIAGARGSLLPEEMDNEFDERLYARSLINELTGIPSGNASASDYHRFCIGALTFLLYPNLISPVKEQEIDQGRKRIDISYTNAARDGFFESAIKSNQLRAIRIAVECKNYTSDVANPELDQIAGRFSHARGFLGLLCCRSFDDRDRFISRCRDAAVHRGHYVLTLDDDDFRNMLTLVEAGARAEVDSYVRRLHGQLIA